MGAKNNTHIYVAWTSNNRVIAACDLYCCLLPQFEVLRTCRSGFPITTKWSCDQDLKVVASVVFAKRTCNQCGSLQKGDVVATSPLALRLMCDSLQTGCAQRTTPIYMWPKQAIMEWSRCVISVACCWSVKLCTLATRAFRSQQLQNTNYQKIFLWMQSHCFNENVIETSYMQKCFIPLRLRTMIVGLNKKQNMTSGLK